MAQQPGTPPNDTPTLTAKDLYACASTQRKARHEVTLKEVTAYFQNEGQCFFSTVILD